MRPLVVLIVFFGELPPWLPITLHSMALNSNVSFVVISDARPPAILPPNVQFETVSWPAMQVRLSLLLTPSNLSTVHYFGHYKANDIKPLAAEMYPQHVRGFEWWAWADLDVLFGDLLKFMRRSFARPACCKVPLRANGQPRSMRAVNVYLHRLHRLVPFTVYRLVPFSVIHRFVRLVPFSVVSGPFSNASGTFCVV